jgi:hypothetical protein
VALRIDLPGPNIASRLIFYADGCILKSVSPGISDGASNAGIGGLRM